MYRKIRDAYIKTWDPETEEYNVYKPVFPRSLKLL